MYALLKKAFFSRYQKPWSWPEGVPQDQWERVEFRNHSGKQMVGLLARAHGEARGTVVIPHPMVAEAKAFAMRSGHADFLRDAGYNVFVFDFNGFGESESGKFEFPQDIVAGGNAAAERAPGLPVALLGISMGAGYGVCALDTPGHPFRAAVLESAFTSLEEFWRRYKFPYLVLRGLGVVLPRLARELRPIDRVGSITGVTGLLFIHGDKDSTTPPAMGERLLAACTLPADQRALWVAPGARHLRTLQQSGDEYRQRILAFLDHSLAPAA